MGVIGGVIAVLLVLFTIAVIIPSIAALIMWLAGQLHDPDTGEKQTDEQAYYLYGEDPASYQLYGASGVRINTPYTAQGDGDGGGPVLRIYRVDWVTSMSPDALRIPLGNVTNYEHQIRPMLLEAIKLQVRGWAPDRKGVTTQGYYVWEEWD